ncbi:MAG: helix-turn-helix transcriptional regulator, partial [Pseudomonadota bacterium]
IVNRLRTELRLTQAAFAEIVGTSQATIAAYETGRKTPNMKTLEKMAAACDRELVVESVPQMTREDRRSLALHRAIVQEIIKRPEEVLLKARQQLRSLRSQHPHASRCLDQWQAWLKLPQEELFARMLDLGLFARDMRQVSPFGGVLSAARRAEIIRDFRARR